MRSIILYFGSFNPVHNGHIAIGEWVLGRGVADELWFVVSPQNPLKASEMLAPEADRLEMMKLAIAQSKYADRMRACDIEFGLPRPSYTIDTLEALDAKYPAAEFSLLVGSDILPQLERWKEWRKLLADYKIYVYPRPGYDIEGSKKIPDAVKEKITPLVGAPLLECSSTQVRELARSGESLAGMVPDPVADYIKTHSLWTKR